MRTAAAGLARRSAVKPRVTQATEHFPSIALTHDAILVGITNYKLQHYSTTLFQILQEKKSVQIVTEITVILGWSLEFKG